MTAPASRLKLTRPEPPEAIVLDAVLTYLALDRRVAWYARVNSGAGKLLRRNGQPSQFIRFAWVGAADITGQLMDGRRLEIEVKRPSGRVSPEQAAFLAKVQAAGGVACVARGIEDVQECLNSALAGRPAPLPYPKAADAF